MKKKTKRVDPTIAEKAALKQRLADMACGADGDNSVSILEGGEMFNGEWLSRWLCAVQGVLLGGRDGSHAYLVGPANVGEFCTLDSATEHLYGMGVRADLSHLTK